jgi:hypothetical protein
MSNTLSRKRKGTPAPTGAWVKAYTTTYLANGLSRTAALLAGEILPRWYFEYGTRDRHPTLADLCTRCHAAKHTILDALEELRRRKIIRIKRKDGCGNAYAPRDREDWSERPLSCAETAHLVVHKLHRSSPRASRARSTGEVYNPAESQGKSGGRARRSCLDSRFRPSSKKKRREEVKNPPSCSSQTTSNLDQEAKRDPSSLRYPWVIASALRILRAPILDRDLVTLDTMLRALSDQGVGQWEMLDVVWYAAWSYDESESSRPWDGLLNLHWIWGKGFSELLTKARNTERFLVDRDEVRRELRDNGRELEDLEGLFEAVLYAQYVPAKTLTEIFRLIAKAPPLPRGEEERIWFRHKYQRGFDDPKAITRTMLALEKIVEQLLTDDRTPLDEDWPRDPWAAFEARAERYRASHPEAAAAYAKEEAENWAINKSCWEFETALHPDDAELRAWGVREGFLEPEHPLEVEAGVNGDIVRSLQNTAVDARLDLAGDQIQSDPGEPLGVLHVRDDPPVDQLSGGVTRAADAAEADGCMGSDRGVVHEASVPREG